MKGLKGTRYQPQASRAVETWVWCVPLQGAERQKDVPEKDASEYFANSEILPKCPPYTAGPRPVLKSVY